MLPGYSWVEVIHSWVVITTGMTSLKKTCSPSSRTHWSSVISQQCGFMNPLSLDASMLKSLILGRQPRLLFTTYHKHSALSHPGDCIGPFLSPWSYYLSTLHLSMLVLEMWSRSDAYIPFTEKHSFHWHLLSVLWPAVSFCINCPLHKETSVRRLDNWTNAEVHRNTLRGHFDTVFT